MAELKTKPCPGCGGTQLIEVSGGQLYRMLTRYASGEHTSAILSDMSPDVWERFITGMCPGCWDKEFSDD